MKSPIQEMLKQCGNNQSELARRMEMTRQQVNDIVKSGIIPEKHALMCERLFNGVKANDILVFNDSLRAKRSKSK